MPEFLPSIFQRTHTHAYIVTPRIAAQPMPECIGVRKSCRKLQEVVAVEDAFWSFRIVCHHFSPVLHPNRNRRYLTAGT
jgi:hypothetical protein